MRKIAILICILFIAAQWTEESIAAPVQEKHLKEEMVSVDSGEVAISLFSRFLRNMTLDEITDEASRGNGQKGNCAVAVTYSNANEKRQLAGIYYYNQFPDFQPNTEIYSSFFWDHSEKLLYWIVVDHSPPFQFDLSIYRLNRLSAGIGDYPDFIDTPISAWPQPTAPIAQYHFNTNGYGDFLLTDMLFDCNFKKNILSVELKDRRKSDSIHILYDFSQRKWNCQ